ncbi:MAG: motility-associated protein [Opitutaceae bacterium]
MLIIVGAIIVLASTLGGFMYAGGKPILLLHASEFIVILGISAGMIVIATPGHILKEVLHKSLEALKGKTISKKEFTDLFKLLYEIFMVGRRNGLIALEEHVMDPKKSAIFQRYPAILNHPVRLAFIVNGLTPIIDGKIKPDQIADLMEAELDAKSLEAEHPVHVLQLIADSLPAIGIVAAVLGIINTMSAIAEGPEAVGEKVAAALTGTLLGIFIAYGFVSPLCARLKSISAEEEQFLRCIMSAVSGFAKGLAPLTAVEVARRSLDSHVQPAGPALETMLKAITPAK